MSSADRGLRGVEASVREHGELPRLDDRRLADRLYATAELASKRLGHQVLKCTPSGLKAGGVVGIVAAPGVTLEILPKIGREDGAVRKALVSMLSVTWDLRLADGELAGHHMQRSDLLEILIGLFANRLLEAVRRGLPRRYIAFEEDLGLLRGSLNVVRQVTALAARPEVLACRYEELSEDTPLNRVLKAAVKRLLQLTQSAANARLLRELAARLEWVGDSPAPLKEPVRWDRTNASFHDLHRLARLLLSGDWQSTTGGEALGFSLLFPMANLFERFVGKLLQRSAISKCVSLQKSGPVLLDHNRGRLFNVQPDVVVHAPTGPIVLDTKWKNLEDGKKLGVAKEDIYQMLLYGQAWGAKRLVLLYPWRSELGEKGIIRSWRVQGTQTPLDIATVDVGEPSSVPSTLREILAA